MPTFTTIIADSTIITGEDPTDLKQWPIGERKLIAKLLDTDFTSADEDVILHIQCSWDGGSTFPYIDTNQWAGDEKGNNDAPPKVVLGPFRDVNGINNPTHVRFVLARGDSGRTVKVGLQATIDEL